MSPCEICIHYQTDQREGLVYCDEPDTVLFDYRDCPKVKRNEKASKLLWGGRETV